MFIDILISLFLFFALFAGLVSALYEVIAQLLKKRANLLYKSIQSLLGDDSDHYISKLFAHPLISTLSRSNSKPSYIEPSTFSNALVQVLSNDGSLISLRSSLEDRSTSLGKLFGPMLDQANDDIAKFKVQVESHFNSVMDRVAGWYKRSSQILMFFVALALAIGLNADTIHIAKHLKSHPELVNKMIETIEKNKSGNAASPNPSAGGLGATPEKAQKTESPTSEVIELKTKISHMEQLGLQMGWPAPQLVALKDVSVNYTWMMIVGWWLLMIVGWLLTAIAATLGAPFWFDAISKLFAIRGTGKKPESPSTTSGTPSTPVVQAVMPSATLPAQLDSSPLNDFEATGLNGEDIEGLQRALGLPGTQINGQFSAELRAALRKWQGSTGRIVTGQFDEPTVMSILYSEF